MVPKSTLRPLALAMGLLATDVMAADVTAQDMQIVGRALSFKETQKREALALAVIYVADDRRSEAQMSAVVATLRGGLKVGKALLKAMPIEQSHFSSASRFDGVFITSSVDQEKLRLALRGSGVPCFTIEAEQVETGACTLAIRSKPSVSVSINSRNAADAGVHFATAFMMMVSEI